MAKKKSKTQKSKQNQKKKINTAKKITSTVTKEEKTTQAKVSTTKKEVKKSSTKPKSVQKKDNAPKKETPKKTIKKEQTKKVVDKKEVNYNVVLDTIKEETKPKKEKQLVDKDKVQYNVVLKKELENKIEPTQETKTTEIVEKVEKNKKKVDFKSFFTKVSTKTKEFFSKLKSKLTKKNKNEDKKVSKNVKKNKKKNIKKPEESKPKNIIIRAFYELKRNFHIVFNVALIITFIILLTGLIRSNAFTKGTIIYISCIAIFLIIVAASYTKYLSGKAFSILILTGMILGIYNIQYTYDFINNLNSNQYEYKTYYVVTFNNGQNKSIYNINNKKVCLLKDNSKNIERKLNTKLDSVIYVEHEDPNKLYSEFYDTNCRAIIVNENQYKYLTNNIEPNSRNIKILYEFKANGKK